MLLSDPPALGSAERERWERSEELRGRRAEEAREKQTLKRALEDSERERVASQKRRQAWGPATPTSENTGTMTMMTWNCDGLKQAMSNVAGESFLEGVVGETGAKVVLLQETKMRLSRSGAQRRRLRLLGEEYTVYNSWLPANKTRTGRKVNLPRHQQHLRAGVTTMIHKALNPTVNVHRIQEPKELQGYVLCLKVRTQRGHFYLVNVYQPPGGDGKEDGTGGYEEDAALVGRIRDWLGETLKQREPCVIGGDLNKAWTPGDRQHGALTKGDREYVAWAERVELAPAGGVEGVGGRAHTYESRATTGTHMGVTSRIDDWLVTTSPGKELGGREVPGPPEVHVSQKHMSDHHPLLLRLDMGGMGIKLAEGTGAGEVGEGRRVKRLKRNLSAEDKEGVREALADELLEDIARCHDMVRALRGHGRGGGEDVEKGARAIHAVLKAGLEVALSVVGEDVRYTGEEGGGGGPKGRRNQKGMLREQDKRKFQRLNGLRQELRAVGKRPTHEGESEPAQLARLEERMEAEIGRPDPGDEAEDGTPRTWRERAAVALKHTRKAIRRILWRHDKRQQWKVVTQLQHMLRVNPKKAHRFLFENTDRHNLTGLRMATGEVTMEEQEVIAGVTEYFRRQQEARVPADTAREFPWDAHRAGLEEPLIKDSGGRRVVLGGRYNREIYRDALARLPGGKAAGPDEIPNEVLKWLPTEFHDMLHEFFVVLWERECTPTLWKDALTILLYKKDDPFRVENYRPIGLKRTIYKLWTATVTRVLTDYVEENGLLSDAQEGFRRKKSTRNQVSRLSKALEDSILTDRNIYVLYVDFVDAFGSVDHARLGAIMEAMGIPDDAVRVVRNLYEGASVTVRTPKGDTDPIPIVGRGTVQGDTLSPLLFVLFIDPLMRWLEEGGEGYRFGTSEAKLGPMAYADDLAVVAGRMGDLHAQANKVQRFCEWAGLKVNVDVKRKQKTAWSGVVRDGDKREKAEMEKARQMGLDLFRGAVQQTPYLQPNESYTYLGVSISPQMNWTKHWQDTKRKTQTVVETITCSNASEKQKLELLETVVRPMLRYSMMASPFSRAEVQRLHGIVMGAARSACGLGRNASTGLMMAPRGDFGVGFDSTHHTYAVELHKTTLENLKDDGDVGVMSRGLWDYHVNNEQWGQGTGVREAALARCPTLRAMVYLKQLGVEIRHEGEGEPGRNVAEWESRAGGSIERAVGVTDKFGRLLGTEGMKPLRDAGLDKLEDFVSYDGRRMLTIAELRKRHDEVGLTGVHAAALRGLARGMGCGEGNELPEAAWLQPREGPIQAAVSRMTGAVPRGKVTVQINKRRGQAANEVAWKRRTAHLDMVRERTTDDRVYEIERKVGQRSVQREDGTTQIQYKVEWRTRAPDGSKYPDEWISKEDMVGGDLEGEGATKRRTDKDRWEVPVSMKGEHAGKRFLRVRTMKRDEESGALKVMTGTLFRKHHTEGARQRRARYPYRVEWDDSDESDEETDMVCDPEDENFHIEVVPDDEEREEEGYPALTGGWSTGTMGCLRWATEA